MRTNIYQISLVPSDRIMIGARWTYILLLSCQVLSKRGILFVVEEGPESPREDSQLPRNRENAAPSRGPAVYHRRLGFALTHSQ
jgi:hypothetical protein